MAAATPDNLKGMLALGVAVPRLRFLSAEWRFDLSYGHIFQPDRTVAPADSKVYPANPIRPALSRPAITACFMARAMRIGSLASAMAQKKRFPGLLSMFARLGEQTGQLPVMLQRAARQLSTEVQRRALQLATILEPLLIVAMGLIVMLIVLAVLLPIIQLNQLVR